MVKDSKDLSVAELERLLDLRKTEFDSLTRKKGKLERDLMKVEKRMALLGGTGGRRGGRIGKRPKNSQSLHQAITEVLSRTKKGFTLAQIAEKVKAGGYKSNSGQFKNVVYQTLYNSKEMLHDRESGNYRLK